MNELVGQFIAELENVSRAHLTVEIFSDACAWFVGERKEAAVAKYGPEAAAHLDRCMEIAEGAVRDLRSDFLGSVLEAIVANNKKLGQFFTPKCVADLMAGIGSGDLGFADDVVICDMACGSGATLISAANAIGKCRVEASDIDDRAVFMFRAQAKWLGLDAVVEKKDALLGGKD